MIKIDESLIFFISIIFFGVVVNFFDTTFSNNLRNQFLLFLIPLVWPGLAHGSLDIILAKRINLIRNRFSLLVFIFSYLILSLIYFFCWIISPNYSLIFFLIISIIHFGLSDIKTSSSDKLFYPEFIIRGTCPILLPIIFYTEETKNIFSMLMVNDDFLYTFFKYKFQILISVIFILIITFLRTNTSFGTLRLKNLIEFTLIIFCFYFFQPLIAFSIYFCFLHSLRHLIDEKNELKISFSNILIKTLPLTFITLLFLIFCFYFLNLNEIPNSYVPILFISLACLTVPHMLLVCYSKYLKL